MSIGPFYNQNRVIRSTFAFRGVVEDDFVSVVGGIGICVGSPFAIIVDKKCCCIINIIIEVAIGLNNNGFVGGKLGGGVAILL